MEKAYQKSILGGEYAQQASLQNTIREREIPTLLQQLMETLEQTAEALMELDIRIQPILGPCEPSAQKQEGISHATELGSRLSTMLDLVRTQREHLNSLLRRLEI